MARAGALLSVFGTLLLTQPLIAQEIPTEGNPTVVNESESTAPALGNPIISKASLEDTYQSELDKWMLQAYEGDPEAQFKVGALFTNDQFQTADLEQSAYWYKQAARQGHALAQYNLGHQYLTGSGVKRSETEAMKWWLKSAEQDHPLAQFNIGRAYYLGIGLDEDHALSKLWFRRAAKNNEPKSIEILEQLGWTLDGPVTQSNSDTESIASLVSGDEANSVPSNTVVDQKTLQAGLDDLTQATNPIAVYTNPSPRAVLIAILDVRNQLNVISSTSEWTKVSHPNGFPVWVHRDFVDVSDDIGVITGNSVNARSVPLLTNGSIVGKLNTGETLSILDTRDEWYRLMSPRRFNAWVKTEDFNLKGASNNVEAAEPIVELTETSTEANTPSSASQEITEDPDNENENDNDWLFSQASDRYTLQLASFNDPNKIAEFKSRKKFKGSQHLHSFTSLSKDKNWTYFIYGSYSNAVEAKQSREDIGQKLAWVRSFGKLQQNRCVAWKKQIPAPKELNKYCS